jgi:hypothetical protein
VLQNPIQVLTPRFSDHSLLGLRPKASIESVRRNDARRQQKEPKQPKQRRRIGDGEDVRVKPGPQHRGAKGHTHRRDGGNAHQTNGDEFPDRV